MSGRNQHNANNKSEAEKFLTNSDNFPKILEMESGDDLNEIINHISDYVKKNGGNITSSQLRNIFGKIKSAKSKNELYMLRPQLAYISARQEKSKPIIKMLDDIIQQVDESTLKGFQKFVEAIVAYHKFHQPKKKLT